MNNYSYGKTLESKRNMVNVKLVRTREDVLENSEKGLLKSISTFDENLVAIKSHRGQIFWDTPTLVSACIVNLAELHMYDLQYKVSIKRQNYYFHPQD